MVLLKNGITKKQAEEHSQQTLIFANLMLREGLADACVAGAVHPTGDVIRAALQIIGTKTASTRLSSFFYHAHTVFTNAFYIC